MPGARTVREGVEGHLLHSRSRSHLSGGNPSGRRDPRVCLGVGRPPKMPLVDVESKRGEDLWYKKAKLWLLLVTEPPKVLGPPTVVLVLRTLDNHVDAHNHLTSSVTISSSIRPRALHLAHRYYITSEERISGSELQ
jgi:hypothetical protein